VKAHRHGVLFALLLIPSVLILSAIPAVAADTLPSSTADAGVYMVNGPRVDDVVIVNGNTWISGLFSQVQDQNGNAVRSATSLAVLDSSGVVINSIQDALPTFGGSKAVYDLSLAPNGTLYAAGSFSYVVSGKTYKNLVGIDPATGTIAATFTGASGLKSVLATSSFVYGGGAKLKRWALTGGKADTTWHSMVAYVDGTLRSHSISPAFRQIEQASPTQLIVAGQFDWIDAKDADHEKKVAVLVDTASGLPALGPGSWTIDCNCAAQTGAAFGQGVVVANGVAYIAAGGNDWVGAFNISDGSRVWQTDTNGSAQDIAFYGDSSLIVGGHYTSIEVSGAGDSNASECPARGSADQSPCWLQPRLAAISLTDGLAIQSWTPNVCCLYRGIWATTVDGTTVHVGGEFNKLDNDTGPENYYGRFSVVTAP
jgi:hypothetical protein